VGSHAGVQGRGLSRQAMLHGSVDGTSLPTVRASTPPGLHSLHKGPATAAACSPGVSESGSYTKSIVLLLPASPAASPSPSHCSGSRRQAIRKVTSGVEQGSRTCARNHIEGKSHCARR